MCLSKEDESMFPLHAGSSKKAIRPDLDGCTKGRDECHCRNEASTSCKVASRHTTWDHRQVERVQKEEDEERGKEKARKEKERKKKIIANRRVIRSISRGCALNKAAKKYSKLV